MSNAGAAEDFEAVAVIGMACRFPGANTPGQFWKNLRAGLESTSHFSDEQVLAAGVDPVSLKQPNYVKAGCIMSDVEMFDAAYFGITPRDAELMDPQQRLFLECVTEALESASYLNDNYDGLIGLYAGANASTYWENYLKPNAGVGEHDISAAMANNRDFLTTFVSYKLDLRGPSYSLNTGCSTSLVAVHVACQSLLSYQCDVAVAGGVSIKVPQDTGYLHQGVGIASPDGRCRAFDAQAQGTVGGNGVGVVVLKRLSEAIASRDPIHAVIRGSAINNDGSLKVGFAAPSVQGQAEVIALAQAVAGVDAETITYVEAHGSATQIGDPIEVAALTRAFRGSAKGNNFCAIGSVKTNFGHLNSAAGIAGLIKTILAIEHRELPPSLHFTKPNPKINFSKSPFFVNAKLTDWDAKGGPLRAGVSSFGIGGTNAHVIVQEAPPQAQSGPSSPWQLLTLSAKTDSGLMSRARDLADHLSEHPEDSLADVSYTLQVGRKTFDHRLALVCHDRSEAARALAAFDPQRLLISTVGQGSRQLVWMFPGLGEHYRDMGQGLYRQQPTFKEYVDRCAELLKPHLNADIRDVMFTGADKAAPADVGSPSAVPQPRPDLRKMLRRDVAVNGTGQEPIQQVRFTHAALFVIEYSLAQQLISWGIKPQAMIGYSISEYVVACLAGVLSLEDALTLVVRRAAMMEEMPQGAMLAVPLPQEKIQPLLGSTLSIAAINSPELCVVAGPLEAIARLEGRLMEQGVACRRLQASHAFHSSMMEPLCEQFVTLLRSVKLNAPQIPYISNVTGDWIKAEEATDPHYWARHMCQAVQFGEGVAKLWGMDRAVMLEVGPGNTLTSLALQQVPAGKTDAVAIPTMRHSYDSQPDAAVLLTALGRLWLAGVEFDRNEYYAREVRRRLTLPTYPFERQRYWVNLPEAGTKSFIRGAAGHSRGGYSQSKKQDISDWFYIPSWKRTARNNADGAAATSPARWLLFADQEGIAESLARRLRDEGSQVVTVSCGSAFRQIGADAFTIHPQNESNYAALISHLRETGRFPERIAHCWLLTGGNEGLAGSKAFDRAQAAGFYSLLYLTKELSRNGKQEKIFLDVVTPGIHDVAGTERLKPEMATVLGPCIVIAQEYPNAICRNIDVVIEQAGAPEREKVIDNLFGELTSGSPEKCIAYRGPYRWVRQFEAVRQENGARRKSKFREGGVYLITGGLGKVGLILARHLAVQYRAKLILVGRSTFPSPKDWRSWLQTHDTENPTSRKLRKILELEESGAEVAVVQADVADRAQMREAIATAFSRFGSLHGVIHAAGITTASSIPDLTPQECADHFKPKAHGLYTLEDLLEGVELDFCVLLSSTASVLGGLGYFAYSAANNFMDAFSQRRNRTSRVPWISSNWDSWAEEEEFLAHAGDGGKFNNLFMRPGESAEAMERVLNEGMAPQVIVAISDLDNRIEQWIKPESQSPAEPNARGNASHSRPSLQTIYVGPTNEIEQSLVEIWQEVLGIDRIGIHDNFFELGGHSLLGTRIIARVRRTFSIDFPVRLIFDTPTISKFSEVIIERQAGQVGEEALAQLISELDQLSEEGAELLLMSKEKFEAVAG